VIRSASWFQGIVFGQIASLKDSLRHLTSGSTQSALAVRKVLFPAAAIARQASISLK